MSFSFDQTALRQLAELNSFPIPSDGILFFGLRGCVPIQPEDSSWMSKPGIEVATVDYRFPRCTLGQWRLEDGSIAVFPGSTVPYIEYVRKSKEKGGSGTNQLMTGYYRDYRKGIHKPGTASAHEAFRQTEAHAIRRTSDDLDFDTDDRVEYANPCDNIHAGWCMGVNGQFSSAGCQVVVGYPKCAKPGHDSNAGPWKRFHDNAYGTSQDGFPYILLDGRDLQRVVEHNGSSAAKRLRFGSFGEPVEALQNALKQKGFYEGIVDGDFRVRTLRAVLAFQTARFGPHADDGIVGPITSSALGLDTTPRSRVLIARPAVNGSSRRARAQSSRSRRREPARR